MYHKYYKYSISSPLYVNILKQQLSLSKNYMYISKYMIQTHNFTARFPSSNF